MIRRMTAVPLLKRRKLARNSSDGSAVDSEETVVRLRAEKRAVGKRMLIVLNGCVSPGAVCAHGNSCSPDCQEGVIELRQMRLEMLFPDTRPSN